MANYYEILEILENATPAEIKAAYRRLAMKWHPDKNRGNETVAEEQFKKVLEAYEILSDPREKAKYDNWLNHSSSSASPPSPPFRPSAGGLGGFPHDHQGTAWRTIRNVFKYHDIWDYEELGSEYLDLFGSCKHKCKEKGDYFIHILFCLWDSYIKIEEFKTGILLCVDKYVKELNRFREEVIREIENYLTKLNSYNKNYFENGKFDGIYWKDHLRKNKLYNNKKMIKFFLNNRKEYIDDLKNNEKLDQMNGGVNHNSPQSSSRKQAANENSRRQIEWRQQNPQGDQSGSSSPDNPSNNSNQNSPNYPTSPTPPNKEEKKNRLQQEISSLENRPNRTAEEENQLSHWKEELEQCKKEWISKTEKGNKGNDFPWQLVVIITIGGIVFLVSILLFIRKKRRI